MLLVSNAPIYSTRPITGWFRTTPEKHGDKIAFLDATGANPGKHLSVRGDGAENDLVKWVDGIGDNELFTVKGSTAATIIGEGPKVLAVVEV